MLFILHVHTDLNVIIMADVQSVNSESGNMSQHTVQCLLASAVSCLHLLYHVYICCITSTSAVSRLHLMYRVYICCITSASAVPCLHLLYHAYICCITSASDVSRLHLLCHVYICFVMSTSMVGTASSQLCHLTL
jgi:hypothetical protein